VGSNRLFDRTFGEQAFGNLASALHEMGRDREAIDVARRSVELSPHFSLCLARSLSACLSPSLCLSVCLSASVSVSLSLFLSLSFALSLSLSLSLSLNPKA